jgi:hypothetical protein
MKRVIMFVLAALAVLAVAAGCNDSNADVAAKNISTEAEQFKVVRQITFVDTFNNTELFRITGLCSIDPAGSGLRALAVVCKTGPNSYVKDYLGNADNVTWIVQQLRGIDVSTYRYEVVIKPFAAVPNFDSPSNSNKGATGDTGTVNP